MRSTCKECGASYRYPHDLEEHQRVGHVTPSTGPTWSDKDVEEEPAEEAQKESPLEFNGDHAEFGEPAPIETEEAPEQ